MDIKESNSSLSVDIEKSFKICIAHSAVHIHIFLYLIFMEQDNIAIHVFSEKDQAKARWENFKKLKKYIYSNIWCFIIFI